MKKDPPLGLPVVQLEVLVRVRVRRAVVVVLYLLVVLVPLLPVLMLVLLPVQVLVRALEPVPVVEPERVPK